MSCPLVSNVYSLTYDYLSALPEEKFLNIKPFDDRIEKTAKYLAAHFVGPFSNVDLAEMGNMSVNAFIRLFTKDVGVSPKRFLRGKRVEKACLLLQNTAKSIDEIAAETGFVDRYHFFRTFKLLTGRCPVEYRKLKVGSLRARRPPERGIGSKA